MVHKPGCVIGSLVQHIKSGSISREGPGQFHSNQHPVQCPRDSAVWISSLSGSRLLRSLLLEKVWVGSFDWWFHLAISHLIIHAHVVSTTSWSFLGPALSNTARQNAFCRKSVHPISVCDHKIVFLLVLESSYDAVWFLCVVSIDIPGGANDLKASANESVLFSFVWWMTHKNAQNRYWMFIKMKKIVIESELRTKDRFMSWMYLHAVVRFFTQINAYFLLKGWKRWLFFLKRWHQCSQVFWYCCSYRCCC